MVSVGVCPVGNAEGLIRAEQRPGEGVPVRAMFEKEEREGSLVMGRTYGNLNN